RFPQPSTAFPHASWLRVGRSSTKSRHTRAGRVGDPRHREARLVTSAFSLPEHSAVSSRTRPALNTCSVAHTYSRTALRALPTRSYSQERRMEEPHVATRWRLFRRHSPWPAAPTPRLPKSAT